jgi:hypothetical protein
MFFAARKRASDVENMSRLRTWELRALLGAEAALLLR